MIPFVVRSEFLMSIVKALEEQRANFNRSTPVQVILKPGGYVGSIYVRIDLGNRTEFSAEWERDDPTRFPVRIRAAATALRDAGLAGRFHITHQDGALSISPA